ncbi:Ig-like domain-containing protein [Reichenbachiella versicolor]|uniref:Ig-like domain-containing protein n=1 Tax=Reichenbachiella versicolor TaxID=1821036 RepID=UPI000D6E352D|nr:Ig-like domain-containing protein [Reichenbachiella versicolor]
MIISTFLRREVRLIRHSMVKVFKYSLLLWACFFMMSALQAQTPQWVHDDIYSYSGETSAVATDAAGNVYVASSVTTHRMLAVSKLNSSGTLLWSDTLGLYNSTDGSEAINGTQEVLVTNMLVVNDGGTERLFVGFASETILFGRRSPAICEFNLGTGALIQGFSYEQTGMSRNLSDFKVGQNNTLLLLAWDALFTINLSDLSISQQWNQATDPALTIVKTDISGYQGGSSSPDFFGSKANPTAASMPFFTGSPLANTVAPTDATNYTFPAETAFTFGVTIFPNFDNINPVAMTSSTTPWSGATSVIFRSVVETSEGLFVHFTQDLSSSSHQGIAKMSKTDDYSVEWGRLWRNRNDYGGLLADENSNVYLYSWEDHYALHSFNLDVMANKFDKNGNTIWSKLYGVGTGNGNEVNWRGTAVAIDQTNQEIALALYTDSYNLGNPSSLLLSTNYDGVIQNYTFLSISGQSRAPSATVLDGNGNAYVSYSSSLNTGGTAGVFKVNTATVFNNPTIESTALAADNSYIDVTFNQAVYNTNGVSGALEAADFSLGVSGGSATAPEISSVKKNDNTAEGSASALTGGETVVRIFFSVTDTPNGSEVLTVTPVSNQIFGAAGLVASTTQSNNTVTLNDKLAPTVTGVSSTFADGSYKESVVIFMLVNFSEAVTVTGTPQLELETGTTDRTIDYSSGSGSTTLTFTYTVQAGDASTDLDYTSTSALSLNGGTINDGVGNAANLTLATPGSTNSLGANKDIVIDTSSPSVVISSPAEKTSGAFTATFTFSEDVTSFALEDIAVGNGAASNFQSTSAKVYTATITPAADGAVTIDVAADEATDAAMNGNTAATQLSVTNDETASTVLEVTSDATNGTFRVGDMINIYVQYDEEVVVTGTPQLTLETGTTDQSIDYVDRSVSTLRFVYTVQAGEESSDLDVVSSSSLTLNGGTIKDLVGNDAGLTVPQGSTGGSLSSNKDIVIDALIPTITTSDANSVEQSSATLGGNVSDEGGSSVTDRGIIYSVTATNNTPEIDGNGVTKVANGTGEGEFSASITELSANTEYSFRAFATNSSGTVYGEVKTFTTSAEVTSIDQSETSDVIVYPNPTSDKLYINTPISVVELTDAMGRQIKKEVTNGIIDVSDLENGIYLINTPLQTIRFVKN